MSLAYTAPSEVDAAAVTVRGSLGDDDWRRPVLSSYPGIGWLAMSARWPDGGTMAVFVALRDVVCRPPAFLFRCRRSDGNIVLAIFVGDAGLFGAADRLLHHC